jgi:hypothetical protein
MGPRLSLSMYWNEFARWPDSILDLRSMEMNWFGQREG